MQKIWVTLTEPSAYRFAACASEAGFTALVAPATKIEMLPWVMPTEIPERLIFLSQHAVTGFLQRFSQQPESTQAQLLAHSSALAVGQRTASLLRNAGIEAQMPEDENSEGLLALNELTPIEHGGKLQHDDQIWLIGGLEGRNTIFAALSRKCKLIRCDVYQRQAAQLPQINAQAISAIVVGSMHGFDQANTHWLACGGDKDVIVISPSARVQSHALQMGFSRSYNALGSSPEALIRCLKDNLS
jgi:uroporphyrinogen-III synthase